uniref:CorA-like transporter domain-containing protein n=1 Tax=Colletotrichum fructicola (strain Nara gc5) TaxID=1213859 RepID=L2FL98_COLFN
MAHSPSFAESCKKYDLYPFNLLSASEYGTTVLNEHASKVHESRKLLFLHDENKFKIPVRDVSGSGTVSKINIMNEGALRDFLGDAPLQTHPASQNQPTALVAKPDPACRFIFTSVEQGFKSSLDIHLALARWATSEWRWHVRYLEEKAEQPALTIALKEKRHIETLDPGLLSEMQRWEEKANENIMVMESNVKIMTLLQRFYKELVNDEDFPRNQRRPGRQAVKNFAFQLDEIICDTRMQIDRGKILVKILADRKAVLTFNSTNKLIQHLQTQTALAAEKLAASMYEQANRSAIETIAVRIVTIVTLIYLPATFSSTLFSTDIIKYQEGESFSSLALYRFLQVTIPLMVLTFLGAGAWFWVEWTKRDRESQELKDQYPDSFQRPMKEKP